MVNPLPAPALIFGVLFLLFVWNEFYGLLGLLAGYILFDRNFAYSQIQIDGVPIFITEFCLLTWLVCRIVQKPNSFLATWKRLPLLVRRLWAAYMVVGCYSFFRGIGTFSALTTVRDFALCYYGIVFYLIASMTWPKESYQRLFRFLIVTAFVRAVFVADMKLFNILPMPAAMTGQPAAMSMSLAVTLIFLLSMEEFHLAWDDMIVAILIMSAILIELVRSAWTGLGMALIVAIMLFFRISKNRLTFMLHAAKTFIMIGSGCVLILFLSSLRFKYTSMHGACEENVRVNPTCPSHQMPKILPDAAGRVPTRAMSRPTPPSAPALVPTTPSHRIPKPENGPGPLAQVCHEFLSFFQGMASSNVMTRVWLWRDAWWELSGRGLFSPALQEADLPRYNLPLLRRDGPELFTLPIRADGISNERASIRTYSSPEPATWATRIKGLQRLLFGIPFGKPFLPPEVVWMVNSPNRYDPHNSFIAVAYRMGLIGLLILLSLMVVLMSHPIVWLRRLPRHHRFFYIATWASLVNFIVHSLTDNTLENSFKGLWFWILLGLLCRLTIDETPDHS